MAASSMSLEYIQRKITVTLIRWITQLVVLLAPKRRSLVLASRSLVPTWTATIQSSVSPRHIRVLVHEPYPSQERSSTSQLPVHINFHGGAFVLKNLGNDAEHCVYMADTAGCVVVDADYAKGPEYPFPAALEDALDILTWVRSNPKGNWDINKISVGGYSSGGNLAISLTAYTLHGLGSGRSPIKAVVAWYPPADYSRRTLPKEQLCYKPLEPGFPGIVIETDFFTKCYVPPGTDLKDPRLSPVYAKLEGFPRTLVICGECDLLCKEGEDFVKAVKGAGGRSEFIRIEDAGHAWDRLYKEGEQKYDNSKNIAFSKVIEVLKSVQ